MDRNFIAGAVVIVAVASAAAVILKHHGSEAAEPTIAPPTAHHAFAPKSRGAISVLVPEQQRAPAADASEDAALVAHVEHKYRYLIGDIDRAYVDELKRRLLARESEASLSMRERMDTDIGDWLPPNDYAYYQTLKDSDLEQHRLSEYTGGIRNVAPLDARQERLVLEAKLRQKQGYAAVMLDAGVERETLSPAERRYAHERAAAALKQYLDEFLMEVSPSLTAEQYTMLENYESTEFARELSRLQQLIDAK